VGVVRQAVKESIKRLEGERAEVMGLGVHSGFSFICVVGDSDDSLPEKKMHFCFNHQHNPDAGSRSQKIWEFKRF
jgi:hypothetical protein